MENKFKSLSNLVLLLATATVVMFGGTQYQNVALNQRLDKIVDRQEKYEQMNFCKHAISVHMLQYLSSEGTSKDYHLEQANQAFQKLCELKDEGSLAKAYLDMED